MNSFRWLGKGNVRDLCRTIVHSLGVLVRSVAGVHCRTVVHIEEGVGNKAICTIINWISLR